MGRPSTYSEPVAEEICRRLAEGEGLNRICRDDHMPPRTTVIQWTHDRPEFADRYTRARDEGLDAMAEELMDIADDGTNDFIPLAFGGDDDGGGKKPEVFNSEHVQRSKLRVDARKWYLSKLAPKRYGDRQHVEHSGEVSLVSEALAAGRRRAKTGE